MCKSETTYSPELVEKIEDCILYFWGYSSKEINVIDVLERTKLAEIARDLEIVDFFDDKVKNFAFDENASRLLSIYFESEGMGKKEPTLYDIARSIIH